MKYNLPIPISYAKSRLLIHSPKNFKEVIKKEIGLYNLAINRHIDFAVVQIFDKKNKIINKRNSISTKDFIELCFVLNIPEGAIEKIITENNNKYALDFKDQKIEYNIRIRTKEELISFQKSLTRNKSKGKKITISDEDRKLIGKTKNPSHSFLDAISNIVNSNQTITFIDTEFKTTKNRKLCADEIGIVSVNLRTGKVNNYNYIFNRTNHKYNFHNMDMVTLIENNTQNKDEDLEKIKDILQKSDKIIAFSPHCDIKVFNSMNFELNPHKIFNIQYSKISLENMLSKHIEPEELIIKKNEKETKLLNKIINMLKDKDKSCSKKKEKSSPFIGDIPLHNAFNDALLTFKLFSKLSEIKDPDNQLSQIFQDNFKEIIHTFKERLPEIDRSLQKRFKSKLNPK